MNHLRYHKFKHNFQGCFHPICDRGLETETTTRFLLHYPLFQGDRQCLLINIKGTVMQVKKALLNDYLHVLKVS